MTGRRLIRQLHVWVGLALSLVLFVFGVTGTALVYKEAYWRLAYPALRLPDRPVGAAEAADGIAAAEGEFGTRLRSVKLPEPGVPAYHLYLQDGEAFLSRDDHRVIDEWGPHDRVMGFLFDLHAHLMAGETGERVGGYVALLGVFLSVTGLVLWWPTRRLFRLRDLLPRGLSRRALLVWHRNVGISTSPILLIVLLTGSGLVFYSTAGAILNGLFGDAPVVAANPSAAAGPPVRLADAAMLARVEEEFPDARLVFYYPPRDGIGYSQFRLKQPCELHPNGRSYLDLDVDGRVLRKTDACASPPGEKALQAMYPLHAGKTESGVYRFLTFLGGLGLTMLSLSGGVGYARKLAGRG